MLSGCGDKQNEIDRPNDQGYNDSGLNDRETVPLDTSITDGHHRFIGLIKITSPQGMALLSVTRPRSFTATLAVPDVPVGKVALWMCHLMQLRPLISMAM